MARPRTPTALKELKGTINVTRQNKAEPQPERGWPVAPAHLSERAEQEWRRVCQLMDDQGYLTLADFYIVELYCEDYARLLDVRAKLNARGGTTYESTNKDGTARYYAYPEVAMERELVRAVQSHLTKLGLTPADRSRVSVVSKQDGAEDFSLFD